MSWTREDLILESADYFTRIVTEIDRAQRCIMIECYIVEEGKVFRQILAALEKAVERGVEVRFVMDAVGSFGLSPQILTAKNISVRIYHPLRLFELFKFNIRNHKKVIIIDHQAAFIGSQNIFDNALIWREAGVILEGPEIEKLVLAFEMSWTSSAENEQGRRWFISTKSAKQRLRSVLLFFNTPWSLRRLSNHLRRSMIKTAQKQLWIASPYFIPEKRIIALLRKASSRGVDVRLLLPSQSDVPFTVWVAHYLLPKLLVADVRVFEYKPCMMHAKVWLIDGQSIVGTSNLNHRSYKLDLEVDAKLTHKENHLKINNWFEDGFENSNELFLQSIPSNWWQRILVKFIILFQGWM